MTNLLVKRLRARSANPDGLDALMDDAASEIERLRAERDKLLELLDGYARREFLAWCQMRIPDRHR